MTRVSVQHHQLGSHVAAFHVGSIDGVAFDVTQSNVVHSAVLTQIGHCVGRRIDWDAW